MTYLHARDTWEDHAEDDTPQLGITAQCQAEVCTQAK